jgi:hypothetical protein
MCLIGPNRARIRIENDFIAPIRRLRGGCVLESAS